MKKSVKIILHIAFWAFFPLANAFAQWSGQFGFMSDIFGHHPKGFFRILFENARTLFVRPDLGQPFWTESNLFGILFHLYVYIILPIGIFYLFYGVFIPKVLKNNNVRSKLIPVLCLVAGVFAITTFFGVVTIAAGWGYTHSLVITYIIAIAFSILGSLFRISENWITTEKLARQNLQSELALLKNQISPHFLFNTLNNIDSLIRTDADKASDMLLKLSDMMRYMIYDTSEETVSLSDEISQIESYMELQRIQSSNLDMASLSVKGSPENIRVAPILFIPFVENAFKHCTDKTTPHAIVVSFSIDKNIVIFECTNVYDRTRKISKDHSGGVGLAIVKRRLELIYPGRYSFRIKELNKKFSVTLSLMTDEN